MVEIYECSGMADIFVIMCIYVHMDIYPYGHVDMDGFVCGWERGKEAGWMDGRTEGQMGGCVGAW